MWTEYVVTGANGFIGSHLIKEILKNANARVIALVRKNADLWRLKGVQGNLIICPVDFQHYRSILEAVQRHAPQVLFHLAWEGVTNVYRNDPIQHKNLLILQYLLDMARDLSIGTFIGLGSQAEYGIKNHPITEDESLNPTTLYGLEKIKAYDHTQKFCRAEGIKYIWLRLFSSYGPMDNSQWLIPYVINSLLENKAPLLTQGSQIWDYLYVEDVARALFLSASIGESGVFNLGSGMPVTIKEVVQIIYKELKQRQEIPFGTMPFRGDQSIYLQANMRKFFLKCPWKPLVSVHEGVVNTIEYYKNRLEKLNTTALLD